MRLGIGIFCFLWMVTGCNFFTAFEDKTTEAALEAKKDQALDNGDHDVAEEILAEKLEDLEAELASALGESLKPEQLDSLKEAVKESILDSLREEALETLKEELKETDPTFVDSIRENVQDSLEQEVLDSLKEDQALLDSLKEEIKKDKEAEGESLTDEEVDSLVQDSLESIAEETVEESPGELEDAVDEKLDETLEEEAEEQAQEDLEDIPEEEIKDKEQDAIIKEGGENPEDLTDEQAEAYEEYVETKRESGQSSAGQVVEGGILEVAEDIIQSDSTEGADIIAHSASDDGAGLFWMDSVDQKVAKLTQALEQWEDIPESYLTEDDKNQMAVVSGIRISLNLAALAGEDTGLDTIRVSKSGLQTAYGSQNPSFRSKKDKERVQQISEDIFRISQNNEGLEDSAKEDFEEFQNKADPNRDRVVTPTEYENYVKQEYLGR